MKPPRPLFASAGLPALRSATRAAVAVPAVFAFATGVIGQPQTAIFAAFGSFAMLALADFDGPLRARVLAYLALAAVGAALVVLGTLCALNPWLAAGAMAAVGFVILFSKMISGFFAAAGTAAVLAFVLAVSIPVPAPAIGWRLAGWGLAAVATLAAITLLWPPRVEGTLRGDAAGACLALAALADALAVDHGAAPAQRARAQEAVDALRRRLAATPHRLTGSAGREAALAELVDELGWLCSSLAAEADAPTADLCRAQNSEAMAAAAAVLRASAGRLAGRDDLPDMARLAASREAVAQTLSGRVARLPPVDDDVELQLLLGPSFRIHAIAGTVGQIAGYALAACGVSGAHVDESGHPARREPGGIPAATASRAHALNPRAFLAGVAAAAEHGGARSVWFRNSVRGAAGLAIAVFVAQRSGLQYSFWIVLGALSVLRSNALGTGRSVLGALAGTAAGIVVGAVVLMLVGAYEPALWALLPVAVLFAVYTPRAVSFAVGQAGFTVAVLVLFNIIDPAGWTVGLIRIEDVAVGCAIGLAVGLVFWPRGAAAVLREHMADAYARGADFAAAAVAGLASPTRPGRRSHAGQAATALHQLDDAFRAYLAERSGPGADSEAAARLVAGATRLSHVGRSLTALDRLPSGGREPVPCAGDLALDAQSLRLWYVTLGHSLASSAPGPPPQRHDPDSRSRLLCCARKAIVSGRASAARDALSALWAGEHLDALRRLESHLGEQAAAMAKL